MKFLLLSSKQILEKNYIDKIVDLYFQCRYDFLPDLYVRNDCNDDETLKRLLKITIEERIDFGNFFILIEFNGKIIGFNNHLPSIKDINGVEFLTAVVGTTCILSEYRDKGIGKSLYSFMEDTFKNVHNCEAVLRTTWSSNLKQLGLYEKFNYSIFSIKNDHYGITGLDSITFYKIFK